MSKIVRSLTLLCRVSKAYLVIGFVWLTAGVTVTWISGLDRDVVAPATTSLSPVFVIVCLGGIYSATTTAVPSYDALDASGLKLYAAFSRALTPIMTLMTVLVLAFISSRAAESAWHRAPLVAAGLIVAAATIALFTIAPPAVSGLLTSAYVLACFSAGRDGGWWDLVFRAADRLHVTVAVAAFFVVSVLYLAVGSRPPHTYEFV